MSRMLKALEQLQAHGDFASCPVALPPFPADVGAPQATMVAEPLPPVEALEEAEEREEIAEDAPAIVNEAWERPAGPPAVADCQMAVPIDIFTPADTAGAFEVALCVSDLPQPTLPPPLPEALPEPIEAPRSAGGPYEALAEQLWDRLGEGAPAAVVLATVDRADPSLALCVPLAKALAVRFRPLLVVDCDVQDPGLADRFATPCEQGLLDILPGPARWQEVIRPTQLSGVDLLPGRRLTAADGPAPVRLDLEPLMREWLERYRLVLLVPATLDRPDTRSLLRCVHAAILVVESGRTRLSAARRADRLVRAAGANLLGSIVVR